ncbi:MAG: right-handed parallel beta-helix repeat-containing protein [Acidobacteria bacterium]|nr:right-handed parallel beta-helix repeat-containing protein [Acidobacteriota bacterium]
MNKSRFILHTLAAALLVTLAASAANAQATRTWVSGVGDDVNPCSRTAPCKTFAGAISKTAAGGEIDALDPGGYGTVTITKSIVLDGTGTLASILASGTNGVNVNDSATATPGNIFVVIRNISINGAGTTLGVNGINFVSGKELNVIDCVIQNFSNNGINGVPTVASAGAVGRIGVVNTVIKHCAADGIALGHISGNQMKAAIERTSTLENGNGVHVKSNARASAYNCVFSANNTNGVFSDAATAGTFSAIEVWSSQISMNGANGVRAGTAGDAGASTLNIAQNIIGRNVGNGALVSTGGTIGTFSNNSILGNGTDGCPSCTPVGPGN